MRLVQEKAFSPIAIVLETKEEAETFWRMVRESIQNDNEARQMAIKISNLFGDEE